MHVCRLCGSRDIGLLHEGTRDRKEVNVLKCQNCGLVFLSKIESGGSFYADGNMHQGIDFSVWRENTRQDDFRRFEQFKSYVNGKAILDFGCGNGGFLNYVRDSKIATDLAGIEQDTEACGHIRAAGIKCYQDITLAPPHETYNVIFMFHVIEHLPEPEDILRQLKSHMEPSGTLVIETPNANDALLSIYDCKAFADFTYWSPHIYLYNEETLTKVVERAGLKVVEMEQYQRYPLANHLRWLAKGIPGGGVKEYREFDEEKLNDSYANVLKLQKACDTLVCTLK